MLDYLFPQILEKRTSQFNGEILVKKYHGKIIVYVNNTEQSGPWVKKVWSKLDLSGNNVLILGLGAGSIVSLIGGKITGVEIDPTMAELGEKYFPSQKKIIITDASKFIKGNKKKFDLILVDIYKGQNFPATFESQEFLQRLAQTLSKDGKVIFNRLTTKNAKFEREKFIDKLRKYLKIQKEIEIDFNNFFICKAY